MVKHLHRTGLVGVSLRLFPTRLAIVLRLRMIYLFEFLPCNSLNAARVAVVAPYEVDCTLPFHLESQVLSPVYRQPNALKLHLQSLVLLYAGN
jgi:hypothetical protein